ncbi:hypothetical protein MRX96_050746 [Rhipicephalus microplus]
MLIARHYCAYAGQVVDRMLLSFLKESMTQVVEPSSTSPHHVAEETSSHNSARAVAPISLTTDDPVSNALPTSSDEQIDSSAVTHK